MELRSRKRRYPEDVQGFGTSEMKHGIVEALSSEYLVGNTFCGHYPSRDASCNIYRLDL